MTWQASEVFESGDLAEAAHRYQKILQEFPDDSVAKSMLEGLSPSVVPSATIGPDRTADEPIEPPTNK
jgi:hypothetical protein